MDDGRRYIGFTLFICSLPLGFAFPAISAAAVPTPAGRAARPSQTAVHIDTWTIEAHEARQVSGQWAFVGHVRLRTAGAAPWELLASRLALRVRGPAHQKITWIRARGPVRILGPHGLFLTAGTLVSKHPRRVWRLLGARNRPAYVAQDDWRLPARELNVELDRGIVGMTGIADPKPGKSRVPRAVY